MTLDEATPDALLRHHPRYRAVVERIPDAFDPDTGAVNIPLLAATVHAETRVAVQLERLRTYPAPPATEIAARSRALIAEAGPGVEAFLSLSGGERSLVRLVAALGAERVPLCAHDLRTVSYRFAHDWWSVVHGHTLHVVD